MKLAAPDGRLLCGDTHVELAREIDGRDLTETDLHFSKAGFSVCDELCLGESFDHGAAVCPSELHCEVGGGTGTLLPARDVRLVDEALRRLSRTIFGQEHRLALMLAIHDAEDQIVTLSELATTLGLSASSLQRPFHALVAGGLLTLLPAEPSRYRYYQANRSAAWDWSVELASIASSTANAPS